MLICIAHSSKLFAFETQPLNGTINDFAAIFPQASLEELTTRLTRFKTETGCNVVVLTVKSLEGADMDAFGRAAFAQLPMNEDELSKTALFIVARQEHAVGLQVGNNLRELLPIARTTEKLRAQYVMYADGLRPDLGIHGAAHYLFRVIKKDAQVDVLSEEERLENASLRGAVAGPIFAVCLGPFLAFFIGILWGIYATQYGVERRLRLLMGAVFGGATAKGVITVVGFIGTVSDSVFYFIMGLAIPLGIFGSWTEFWMSGADWRGIPRVKERQRKPEDKMGI
jgi:uncharacterized membrane protein YgcG